LAQRGQSPSDDASGRGGLGYSAAEVRAMGLVTRVVPGSGFEVAVKDYARHLVNKPSRALAEVNARTNAVGSNGIPIVNAMTEGFLDRG